MRLLHTFDDEKLAHRLAALLAGEGAPSQVQIGQNDDYMVWIIEEKKVEMAKQLLASFLIDPNASEYLEKEAAALKVMRAQAKERAKAEAASRHRETRAREILDHNPTPFVSIALIGISVVVALASELGKSTSVVAPLSFVGFMPQGDGTALVWTLAHTYLDKHEWWRLITPAFVHFGLMHIFFNMYWVWTLGRAIERFYSPKLLLGIFLISAPLSNLAEYFWSNTPFFGGMSGVIYAFLGYVWMRAKFDPTAPFGLNQQTMVWMFGWLVLCWTGLLGPIANMAHTGGLVIGVVMGYLASGHLRRVVFRGR